METRGKDPLSVGKVLKSSQRLGFIIKKAKHLLALQNLINEFLPPELKNRCAVINIQGSRLLLGVESGARATQLNYLSPEILRNLRFHNQWSYIQSIQTKVIKKPA